MKYGMNMLLWTTDVTDEHAATLEALEKIGYDGVELPIFEKNLQNFRPSASASTPWASDGPPSPSAASKPIPLPSKLPSAPLLSNTSSR